MILAVETNLSRELVNSKARVFRSLLWSRRIRTGILLSLLNSRDTMPRATHMKKPLKISKMPYASMWRTGWKAAKMFLSRNPSA
jgi:hypothetical protein